MQDTMDDDVRISAKRSIQAPQGVWLQTEPMRSYIHNLIRSESFGDRGLFDIDKVHTSFDRFCEGADANSFFVWQWINAEEWFRVFVDGGALKETYPVCPGIQLTARQTEIVSGDTLVAAHG